MFDDDDDDGGGDEGDDDEFDCSFNSGNNCHRMRLAFWPFGTVASSLPAPPRKTFCSL